MFRMRKHVRVVFARYVTREEGVERRFLPIDGRGGADRVGHAGRKTMGIILIGKAWCWQLQLGTQVRGSPTSAGSLTESFDRCLCESFRFVSHQIYCMMK